MIRRCAGSRSPRCRRPVRWLPQLSECQPRWGTIVYADDATDRNDCRIWGLFEDGELKCCSHGMWVKNRYSVGWALSTAPGNQRSGYGRRLLRASTYHRRQGGGPPVALLTATPVAERLYHGGGNATLDYW